MLPTLELEQGFNGLVAGVDEAGRGPLAGPVVAASVIIPEGVENQLYGVGDSKKMTLKAREFFYTVITSACHVGVGISEVDVIDDLNILGATKQAMSQAVSLLPITPDFVLVDGNQRFPCGVPVTPVVKGDSKSLSIAAASVIAKVTRDRIMQRLAEEYPQYGWQQNAGYGTAQHLSAMKQYGITPHHRVGFAPVRLIKERRYEIA